MKLKVLSVFSDKYTDETYKIGDIIEVTDKRGKELLAYPYCQLVKEIVEEVAKPTKKTTRRKTK